MNKYLLSLLLLAPFTYLNAQDADESDASSQDDVEEVVVTGIKQSLKDAIDIKRKNVIKNNLPIKIRNIIMFSSDKNFSSKAIIINILIKGTDKLSDPFLLVISERVEKKATIRINNNDWRYGTSLKKKLPKKRILWYVLNPLVILELYANLHLEGLMLGLFLLGIYGFFKSQMITPILGIAGAISLKLLPLLTLPVILLLIKS